MSVLLPYLLLCLAAALPSPLATGEGRASAAGVGPQPNFLLIIGDDIGVDRVAVYGEHPDPGHTPNIDAMAAQGLLFRNAWAYEVCSSTRAALLTGKHARRTGIGTFILTPIADVDLPVTEVSLADVLAAVGYRTAAIGKWHLSAQLSATNWLTHPLQLGFEHHWGPISNFLPDEGPGAYFDFDKNIDGTLVRRKKYATTDQVDDTLQMIDSFGSEPWFIWLAFNAPHKPLHVPPKHLHSFNIPPGMAPVTPDTGALAAGMGPVAGPPASGAGGAVGRSTVVPVDGAPPIEPVDDPPLLMKAMTEAMDTEIGRLLASLDPVVAANTYVIFVGDNGTNGPSVSPPWDPAKSKSTMYEGGINVPLIITGPTVAANQESASLVHVTDLFATIAELAGADASTALDSSSLATHLATPTIPELRLLYGERFRPNGFGPWTVYEQVARTPRFKYWRFYQGATLAAEHLYDLLADPFETVDLLSAGPLGAEAQFAYDKLSAYIDGLD